MTSSRRSLGVCGALLLTLAGCGGAGPDLADVTGVVTIDGKPYPSAKVIFAPVAKSGEINAGQPAVGVSDEQGRFKLATTGVGEGALVGHHNVTLFRAKDHKANRPDLSELRFEMVSPAPPRFEVVAGGNQIELAFTSAEIRKRGNRL